MLKKRTTPIDNHTKKTNVIFSKIQLNNISLLVRRSKLAQIHKICEDYRYPELEAEIAELEKATENLEDELRQLMNSER